MTQHDRWEKRFSAGGYLFGTMPNAFLARQAPLLRPGMKALAVADGEARNGVWLAEQGLDVLSVDFSAAAQRKARRLAMDRGVSVRFETADLFNWAWPEAAFDVVATIFAQFAPPTDRSRMFQGMKKALKPGGLLLIEGYGLKQLDYRTGGPAVAEQLYTPELLREAFGDFAELSIEAYETEISEGSGHEGMSALVDLVGRK